MSITELSSVERSRQLLLEAVGTGEDVTLVRCGRRVSDELSTAGARTLLEATAGRELSVDELSKAQGEVAVLAGARFSRSEGKLTARVLAIAELRFERVVVLPASFDPSDDDVRAALLRTRAVVFARESDSLGQIAGLCEARLAHDCSFFFDFGPYARAGDGVLDAFGEDELSLTEADLDEWLTRIAAHRTVKTDRAEVMIAAALMDKQVEYAPGEDPGLDAIAREALADRAVSRIAKAASETPVHPAQLGPEAERTLGLLASAAQQTPAPASESSDVRVTAVVLTRDRPQILLRALHSLELSHAPARALVIDNNSAPRAGHAIAEICGAREHTALRRSESNLGCGGGRHLGAELADTEFVFFLDDDAELLPGALDHLLSVFDAHPAVGAVAATVVEAEGLLLHSGGSLEVDHEIAKFDLLCNNKPFSPAEIPPSGPADWCPGGAMMVRRSLLQEFPIDPTMRTHFEDNEWCYRVSRSRKDCFWRSREALVLHNSQRKHPPTSDFVSRSGAVEFLASYARFYELHGLLLGRWLFDHHVPELRAQDGSPDAAAARLLMELVLAKGTDWVLMTWVNGDLDGLLRSHRLVALEAELARERDRSQQLRQEALELRVEAERVHADLAETHARLQLIEQAVTWRLLQRVRAGVIKLLGGEGSRPVRALHGVLHRMQRRRLEP